MSSDLNKQFQYVINTELLNIIQMELSELYSLIDHEMDEIISQKIQAWKDCQIDTLNELSDSIKNIKSDFNKLLSDDYYMLRVNNWCNDTAKRILFFWRQYQYKDDKLMKLIANTLMNTVTTITFQTIYGDMDITKITDNFIEHVSRKMAFWGGLLVSTSTTGSLLGAAIDSIVMAGTFRHIYETGHVPAKVRSKLSYIKFCDFSRSHVPNQLALEICTSLKNAIDTYIL